MQIFILLEMIWHIAAPAFRTQVDVPYRLGGKRPAILNWRSSVVCGIQFALSEVTIAVIRGSLRYFGDDASLAATKEEIWLLLTLFPPGSLDSLSTTKNISAINKTLKILLRQSHQMYSAQETGVCTWWCLVFW